jgi:hypothetical protein
MLFKWIFKKWDKEPGRWFSEGEVVSSCECGYESTGSIMYREFLD